MSFALQLAYKVGIVLLIVAVAVTLMGTLGSVVVSIFNEIDVSLDGAISSALQNGRELANNFINPYVFNGCITAWFTAFTFSIGYTFYLYIQKFLDM